MSRIRSINHYLERCYDTASLLAALSSARTDHPSTLSLFSERQDEQLVDLLHDFAFNGRKLFELVKREGWASAEHVHRPSTAAHEERGDGDLAETRLSIWDVFGMLIHSDRVTIDRSATPAADGNETIGESAWAFNVVSDKHKGGSSTFVFLELLLGEFLDFDRDVRRELKQSTGA
jgi:hypothetical protein